MTFFIGQPVVCINNINASALEKDRIYTVSRIAELPDWICVEGGGEYKKVGPPGWAAWRFRPAQAGDISLFTAMLNDVPLHEKVREGA